MPYTDTCPHCGATHPGLPPGVQTSTQRHCSRGCGRYFTPDPDPAPKP